METRHHQAAEGERPVSSDYYGHRTTAGTGNVIVRNPAGASLVSAVSPEDAGSVRCSEHPDAQILEERPSSGTGDTYLYCPWHSAQGLVIGGRGYLARYEFRKADDRA
jgi:hypothetical protein